MFEPIEFFLSNLEFKDFIDLALLYVIFYYVLKTAERSGVYQVLFGLSLLSVAYYICAQLELMAVYTILQNIFNNLFLILVLIFQGEIRRMLTQIGSQNIFRNIESAAAVHQSEEITKALLQMSKKNIGALIVFEYKIDPYSFIESGVEINSDIKSEMLEAIFHPSSRIHDGAVVIKGGKVKTAGSFLPLSTNPALDRNLGTRHRSALGISEVTDAKVIVLSEENQNIALVEDGKLKLVSDPSELNSEIRKFLSLKRTGGKK